MPTIGDIVDAEFVEHALRDAELALAAVDQHEIGPAAPLALGVFLERAGKAALQHLAHHRVIVAAGMPVPDSAAALLPRPVEGAVESGAPGEPRMVNLR